MKGIPFSNWQPAFARENVCAYCIFSGKLWCYFTRKMMHWQNNVAPFCLNQVFHGEMLDRVCNNLGILDLTNAKQIQKKENVFKVFAPPFSREELLAATPSSVSFSSYSVSGIISGTSSSRRCLSAGVLSSSFWCSSSSNVRKE